MSIYSGFATRALETSYNHHLATLLSLLQRVVAGFLKQQESGDLPDWTRTYFKTVLKLHSLEQTKYLQPKFSEYCSDLTDLLEVTPSLRKESHKFHGIVDEFKYAVHTQLRTPKSASRRATQRSSPARTVEAGRARMTPAGVINMRSAQNIWLGEGVSAGST